MPDVARWKKKGKRVFLTRKNEYLVYVQTHTSLCTSDLMCLQVDTAALDEQIALKKAQQELEKQRSTVYGTI